MHVVPSFISRAGSSVFNGQWDAGSGRREGKQATYLPMDPGSRLVRERDEDFEGAVTILRWHSGYISLPG